MNFIRKAADKVTRFCAFLFPVAVVACLLRIWLSMLSFQNWQLEELFWSFDSVLMHICYVPLTVSLIAGWVSDPRSALYQLPVLVLLLYVRDQNFFMDDKMFDLFLVAFASKHSDRRVTVRTIGIAWAVIALATAVLFCAGQTNDVIRVFTYGTGRSFGFGHPNSTGAAALTLVLALWAAFFRDKHVLTFIVSWAAAAAVYFVFASRTPALMLVIFPVADLLLGRFSRGNNKVFPRLMAAVPVCYCLASVLLTLIALTNPGLLSGNMMARFTYAARVVDTCGVSVLGDPDIFYECEGIVLDNQYLYWILYRGIIPALLGLALEVCMMYRFAKEKDHTGMVWAFVLITAGLMENVYTWLLFFPAPMILFAAVSGTDKKTRLPA